MTSPIPSEPRTNALYHAAPRGALAVWLALAGVAAIFFVQLALVLVGARLELVMGASFSAAIILLVLATRPLPGVLGVRRVPARFLVAAALVGLASWYLRLRLGTLFTLPGNTKGLEAAAVDPDFVISLITVAVLPAIAEELIFRGVIARSLARHSQILAILVSAVLFAAYHMNPMQSALVFPFGLALGYIAVRADSIVPTMIGHAINNAIGIAIARHDLRSVVAAIDAWPQVSLVVSSVVVAGGLALAWKAAPA
jgi:membrane protease YdiL (CAAX protease family)